MSNICFCHVCDRLIGAKVIWYAWDDNTMVPFCSKWCRDQWLAKQQEPSHWGEFREEGQS
jgi:endogenous inhibitor of DNA gyrase (YacG/DUF329 family)